MPVSPGQERLRGARNLGLRHPDHLTQYPQEFAMSKTAITSPELAPPVGPFSQAIEVGGFLYFSGQVAQDPATGQVVGGCCGRDGARLPEPLGGSQGGRQEFR
jgi:hypothetical protein